MVDDTSIKVLMVDSEATWRGGQGQLSLLMKGLKKQGVAVTLAAPPGSAIAARAGQLGIRCLALPIAGSIDFRAAWSMRRMLRDGDFDLVHCHSSHAHSTAFMAIELFGGTSARGHRPLLLVSRRVDFQVARNSLSALKYRRGVDAFLAISNGVRDVLVECGVEESRIDLVPSGIDLDKFNGVKDPAYLLDEFGLAPETPVIGNVAALAPHKSQEDFIRAAHIISSREDGARFFIVGEGSLRPKLERLIDELAMGDRIVLTGFREDVLEILSIFDCFVLSSYLEGLCTSIMDAQSLGIPVVATNTGGVPDLVEDGMTGLLAPPRQPERLAGAVVRMLEDEPLRTRCVEAAKAKSRTYDYRNMVDKTKDVYLKMLGTGVEVN
jgi:glycosyltransferase involved in cell wall biosynthesis